MVPASVLVLDTDRQTGLAIVRSLGRRGIPVVAGATTDRALGMLSRHSDGRYAYPDPAADSPGFVDHLLSYLDASDHEFVFGPSDRLTYLLARHADEIEATGTRVATEDWDRFHGVFDKARLFEQLSTVDVPRPATYAPSSIDDVEGLAPDLEYPAVVKPRSKNYLNDATGTWDTYLVDDRNYVDGPADLVTTYRALLAEAPILTEWPPIVQVYVPGETTTTVVLAEEGEIRAHFQERRLRTVPPSGGSSALLGVVDDPAMRRAAARVIDALGWTGPAQLEFMERPDGEYVLIEVNGRYWGSLPFAINCGVDVPWLHYHQLTGATVTHDGQYRTDVVQRRTSEDLEWLGCNLADGEVAAAGRFVADFVRADHTFVSATDPLPTLWTLGQLPRTVLGELSETIGRATGGEAATDPTLDGVTGE